MIGSLSFVKGFAGVFGSDPRQIRLNLPVELADHRLCRHAGPNHAIAYFGSTFPTVEPNHIGTGDSFLKGRPFSLSDNNDLDFASPQTSTDIQRTILNLDGKFSLCRLVSHDHLILATDLLGAGQLYYMKENENMLFSTHLGLLLQMLSSKARLDTIGLVSVLISNSAITGQTPFAGISRLLASQYVDAHRTQPGTLHWSVNTCAELDSYLTRHDHEYHSRSLLEQFDGLLKEALRRESYSGRAALMLSGGRDSRAIALGWRKAKNTALDTATFGEPKSTDLEMAAKIAEYLGLPHHPIPYDDWDFGTYAQMIVGMNGGMSGLQTSHMIAGCSFLKNKFDTAIVGFLGDAVTGAHLGHRNTLNSCRALLPEPIATRSITTDPILNKHYKGEVEKLLATVAEAYNRRSEMQPFQRTLLLDWTIRQASRISPTFDLLELYCEISYPFYYRPLLKFMFNLPFEWLRAQKLYRRWLGWKLSQSKGGGQGTAVRRELLLISHDMMQGVPGKVLRRLGVYRPVERLDWGKRVQRSAKWLREHTAYCEDHAELVDICQASLDRSLSQKSIAGRPMILFALPICMALRTAGRNR